MPSARAVWRPFCWRLGRSAPPRRGRTAPGRPRGRISPGRRQGPRSKDDAPKKQDDSKPAPVKLGLLINDPKALQGYTLISPFDSSKTFLLDMQGRVVRSWETGCPPALSAFLLDNGHLMRPGSIGGDARVFGPGPGVGGRIQEFTWDGELVWDFKFYNAKQLPHHDMTRLPNGNVLLIVWDRKTAEEAIAAGRRPEMTGDRHLLPDSLVEIKPTGKTTGEVVWEWHLWDHLVQDFDKSKANFGNVAEHPELVNINYGEDELPSVIAAAAKDGERQAQGGWQRRRRTRPPRIDPDYTHFNGVAYNPDLDQIAVSVWTFSEFWIIDHGTTTAEAAGHTGGRSGKGGDLLYRWGNPRAYRAGTKADRKLFSQHNAHWIPRGLPGAGHLLLFNNGPERPGPDGSYSSVDELVLPADSQGRYTRQPGKALRAGPTRVELHRAQEDGLLFVLHFRRPAAVERQHAHLLGRQRHHLRSDAGKGDRLEVRQSRQERHADRHAAAAGADHVADRGGNAGDLRRPAEAARRDPERHRRPPGQAPHGRSEKASRRMAAGPGRQRVSILRRSPARSWPAPNRTA